LDAFLNDYFHVETALIRNSTGLFAYDTASALKHLLPEAARIQCYYCQANHMSLCVCVVQTYVYSTMMSSNRYIELFSGMYVSTDDEVTIRQFVRRLFQFQLLHFKVENSS